MVQPKANIVHLPVYQPGKPVEEVQRELGLSEITKLASNENPYGSSPKVKEAIMTQLDQISIYPDGASTELVNVLAQHHDVEANQLIFGAGSDEIILMIARAFLAKGDETIMAYHTFPQYKHNAEIEAAVCIEVPLVNGTHDLEGMLEKVTNRTKVIWICNPNNPTGTIVSHDELILFIEKVPANVLVVLDEAYCDYSVSPDYPDGLSLLSKYKNVVLLRTFSKIYGLASLRIGYGIGHAEIIHSINQVREPFNTSRIAQVAAIAAIQDQSFVEHCRAENARGIHYLTSQFKEMNLTSLPAHGNFIMVDLQQPAAEVFNLLLKKGFIIRSGHQLGFPTSIRVTVGSQQQNERFIEALKQVLNEVAVEA